MSLERLDRAASAAACDTLTQLGGSLINLGVWTLWAKGVGLIPLAAGMASNLAYNYACSEQEIGEAPNSSPARGCQELSAGSGSIYLNPPGGSPVMVYGNATGYKLGNSYTQGGNTLYWWSVQTRIDGPYIDEGTPLTVPPGFTVELVLGPGANCRTNAPFVPPVPPPIETYPYTDPETGCVLNVDFQGFLQASEGGDVAPVYLIQSPSDDSRANGGRIVGGCNFAPTIYYGGPGGPQGPGGPSGPSGPVNIPVDPDDPQEDGPNGEPWWTDYVKAALGGVVAGITEQVIEAFLEGEQPAMIYRAVSVCEKDESGEPISEAVEIPIPALKAPAAQIARLDAIVELLQAHKNFKQPICGNESVESEGDFRTISFRSESTSPYGKSRLRKRFRYRSMSGLGLDSIVDHWRDFTWESGPIRVRHIGASWGAPEVWAATESEGKRVIRHAGGEAGIDPDQVGRWSTRRSNSSRLGVSDTMKVDTTGGYFWITCRDGSDNRPIAAISSDY